ncbi:MAG TPA: aminotransferase class I/II-fold pyridoxal phosphate-dependent enzyme [Alphaproteobacteria bacterium]
MGDGRRSIFSGIESLARRRSALLQIIDGPNPLEIQVQRILSPTEAVIGGRRTKLFGTNNYLGMTFEPEVKQAAAAAIETNGVGTTASRVASGNLPDHYELERDIAAFVGKRCAIVFSTGFQANLGAIAGLCGAGDVIVMDEECHASIYDAVMLSAARKIKFRHNDIAHLRSLLGEIKEKMARVLIVIESVYSAAGDTAPLIEIARLKSELGCNLLVDEAHSLGMYGPEGSGLVREIGIGDEVEILTGTFSKSFGLMGGFAASNHPDFFCLRYTARAFMFTAALPPPVVAAIRASLGKIRAADDRRARLWRNVDQLRQGLQLRGFATINARSPVVPMIFDDLDACYSLWSSLLHAGFYANLLMPPSTTRGACIIRFSVCSEHTPEDITALLAAIDAAAGARQLNGKRRHDDRPYASPIGIVVSTRGTGNEIHPPLHLPRSGATRA